MKVLRREAPSWNAPIVSFIAVQHRDPFRTLISCILSLRTKDATTAAASTRLFARAHTPAGIAALSSKTIERLIRAAGFEPWKAGGVAAAGRIEAPSGDLHQYGFNGEVVDIDRARSATAGSGA